MLLVCIVAERDLLVKRRTVIGAFPGREVGSGHSGTVCTSIIAGWNHRRTVMLA